MTWLPVLATLALSVGALACESGPAFPVPAGPPRTVALDVEFPVYVLGNWVIDGFSEELREQLGKYNVATVETRAAPNAVAEIDLGSYGNRHAIDVYIVHMGQRVYAGRVLVVDQSPTTLEASTSLVAPLIARGLWWPSLAGPSAPVNAQPEDSE